MTAPRNEQIVNLPFGYINGLLISNDATTPNTVLDVASGQCRDSSNIYDISLSSAITINAATNGLNGLDTGSLAASTVYAVYLIYDPTQNQAHPTGAILSLNLTNPLLPFGYGAYRKIGYWATNSSSHFILGYYSVSGNGSRLFMYDAPQATSITAGTATSATNVNLISLVPNINNIPVWIYSNYIPAAAGNALDLQPAGGTGFPIVVVGQVATVHIANQALLLAQQVTISSVLSPAINYKVASGSDSVAIDVLGFEVNL